MTPDRIRMLDDVEFCWNSHEAVWEEKFAQLLDYRRRFLHCNVPTRYAENPALSLWVKRQRRSYILGKLDRSRIERMESVGFVWSIVQQRNAARSRVLGQAC